MKRVRKSVGSSINKPHESNPSGNSRMVELKAHLSSARRQESRLIKRLGERARRVLTENGSLDFQDPEARIILEDLHRVQRENTLLTQQINALEVPYPNAKKGIPQKPGTDERFPFSR